MRVKFDHQWMYLNGASHSILKPSRSGRVISFVIGAANEIYGVVLADDDNSFGKEAGRRFVSVRLSDLAVDPPDRM